MAVEAPSRPEIEKEKYDRLLTDEEKIEFIKSLKNIHTREEFDSFIREKLPDIQEIDPNEFYKDVERVRLLWRGMDPEQAIELLGKAIDRIELKSKSGRPKPNATYDMGKSISYIQGESNLPFNASLGFIPGREMSVEEARKEISDETKVHREIADYQRDNIICQGNLERDNVKYLLVRYHGKKPGEPGESHIYRTAA